MTRAALIAVLLSTAGCATQPGCYFGFNLIPPSPILICGVDVEPDHEPDE